MRQRSLRFRNLTDGGVLDALVVGGGISGAPLYQKLLARGHRVALIDKGDFASGTSQASGMLIWGGLLYLRNLEFSTVLKLCGARKRLLRNYPEDATPLDLHFLTGRESIARSAMVRMALQLYWLLGGCELERPRFLRSPSGNSHVYQEAMLRTSDGRFVIERIAGLRSEHGMPLNHCRLVNARHDAATGEWRIDLKDEITGSEHHVRSKALINAAGVWADDLNRIAGLDSPCKHVFSKGVYLTFPREGESKARVHPMRGRDDVLTHVPWGPVMMWGPTETSVRDLESALTPDRGDVRFLLDQARHCLRGHHGAEDVVSVRCGVRPLVVPRDFSRDVYPLDLSRRHQVVVHRDKMALSLYGGKFTSSMDVADQAADLLGRWIAPKHEPIQAVRWEPATRVHECSGHTFVTPEWARDHEYCVTLEDYLRRRTNIAQWTPRMGLGRDGEHRAGLLEMARAFSVDAREAGEMVNAYEQRVRILHDPLFQT